MACLFLITARKRSLRRLCFYTCLSFILFTGGTYVVALGACVVAQGASVVAPGGVWLLWGVGRAWLLRGACMVDLGGGGQHGCLGGVWLLWGGACMVDPGGGGVCGCSGGVCMGYDEIHRYGQ